MEAAGLYVTTKLRGITSHKTIIFLLQSTSNITSVPSRLIKYVNNFTFSDTLYPQKLALTSLTSGGSSVGIIRSDQSHGV
jgi:hypothetical protein